MATMTFQVTFVWHGDKKPNVFKRKYYEAEFARVNNWLKKRTNGSLIQVKQLNELVNAYQLVNNDLKLNYSVNAVGELIGTVPETNAFVTFELGDSI
jgi:hypothetical protein